MLNRTIAIARRLIGWIKSLMSSQKPDGRINRSLPGFSHALRKQRGRRRVRYSYLASARRVHIGSIILKRFELNTPSGRRIGSRKFKALKHGNLVAA